MFKKGLFNYSQDIVMAFSLPVVGFLVKKRLAKGGSRAPQDLPLATPLSMSHKPNLLSRDQDVDASPREFQEPDSNRTNSTALLATWQYFFFVMSGFETFILPKIIANYSFLFFKCFAIRARQKKFPDLRKIFIFRKNNEQKNCPPF